MHVVVAGATSLIAQHCLREKLKERVSKVSLIGRKHESLERLKHDLSIRYDTVEFRTYALNFQHPLAVQEVVQEISRSNVIDFALVAFGSMPTQKELEQNLSLLGETLSLTGASACIFSEVLATHMAESGGKLGILSSVAGDRGRKKNYVYGSAKSMLSTYVEGLQHKYANSNLSITLIKPGPVLTPMTANERHLPAGIASPELVAIDIVQAMNADTTKIYTPAKWRYIMFVLRLLPFRIFKHLNI